MEIETIEIVPGSYEELTLNFTDEDGEPLNITGATIYVMLKNKFADDDEDAVFTVMITEHEDAENGVSIAVIEPEDTELIEKGKYYDLVIKLMDADSHPHFPFIGKVVSPV